MKVGADREAFDFELRAPAEYDFIEVRTEAGREAMLREKVAVVGSQVVPGYQAIGSANEARHMLDYFGRHDARKCTVGERHREPPIICGH